MGVGAVANHRTPNPSELKQVDHGNEHFQERECRGLHVPWYEETRPV